MDPGTQLRLLSHVLRWRLTWSRRNTAYRLARADNPKFMSAREAAALIPDGATLAIAGLGGNQRASILHWAIRERFEHYGQPRDLSIICIGGHGGRGRAPGTLEEYACPGLLRRFFSAHYESYKAILQLGQQGLCELHCLPQGIMALLHRAQIQGTFSLVSATGVGTCLDPRQGPGSCINNPQAEQLITLAGSSRLRYRLPPIEVALFNLPAVDRAGNLYARHCAMVGTAYEAALAARRNGGLVIANVGRLVRSNHSRIFLPAQSVDAIVYYPRTEQTLAVYHRKPWRMLTPESRLPPLQALERLRFISRVLGITPRRRPADQVLARLAVETFVRHAPAAPYVNIGTGLPEEVARMLAQCGLLPKVTLLVESGPFGGLPAPGPFFGAAVNPRKILSSPEMFALCYERLDVAIVGALEVDSQGNVNVSQRGASLLDYVGPGGFIDLTTAAKMVIFVCSWMHGGKIVPQARGLCLRQAGEVKFRSRVREITFNGPRALAKGQKVFYVTHVGVFELRPAGMTLQACMPGIDLERDILQRTNMRIVLPPAGQLPLVAPAVVTGKNFRRHVRRCCPWA